MKNILFILICHILFGCMPQSSANTSNVSVQEAKELINSIPDIQIVDVRTPGEWSQGAIHNAIKLNVQDADFSDKISKLSKNMPTLVYCKKGGRSAKATLIMEELGFTQLYNLLGGYDDYSTTN
jgi:rhodanese-related sulfurtransferase